MCAYRASFDEGEWERPRPGIAQKLHHCGEASIRMIQLGYTGEPRDWCSVGHAGYVIEGELQMEFADQIIVYRPGDTIAIPPGDAHQHRPMALSDVKLVLVDVAS